MKKSGTTHNVPRPRTSRRPSRSRRSSASLPPSQSASWAELLPRLLRGLALSGAISLVLGVLLPIVAAAMLMPLEDPAVAIAPTSAAVLLLTALVGGFVTARKAGAKALLCGVCSAGVWLLLTWGGSFCLSSIAAPFHGGTALGMSAATVLLSVLGASLGRNLPGRC